MTIILASLLAIGVIVFILAVRTKDLPEPEPVSPFQYLDERKVAIYENLRDLQFEFRVGKLSDADYQHTKLDLQRELAGVMAEIDRLKSTLSKGAAPPAELVKPVSKKYVCPFCKTEFPQPLKFCGECGKPMKAARA
jgi:hypothetical protein